MFHSLSPIIQSCNVQVWQPCTYTILREWDLIFFRRSFYIFVNLWESKSSWSVWYFINLYRSFNHGNHIGSHWICGMTYSSDLTFTEFFGLRTIILYKCLQLFWTWTQLLDHAYPPTKWIHALCYWIKAIDVTIVLHMGKGHD